MSETLYTRGPDDGGVWVDHDAGIALGHRRLAIIELSAAGHQPMKSNCGRWIIAFNGEIYNHLEIRAKLEREGVAPSWRGHSDTETLLASISARGLRRTLEQCVGMFAVALWDRRDRSLQLARDRMGEKPVYYGWSGDAFLFASELKALRSFPSFAAAVDRSVLATYFRLGAVPAPYSIYEGVRKLEPGTMLTMARSGLDDRSPVLEQYWSLPRIARAGQARPIRDEKEALDLLESTLRTAVASQAVADVPLGAFLSGGVDSSTIVALMQATARHRVKTFTVAFDEAGFDESAHARAIADHLGTDHTEMNVRAVEAQAIIPILPDLYDEPFADSSQIPTHLVCRTARRHVTVALSGDAGDELFGGYNRYLWGRRLWHAMAPFPAWMRHVAGNALNSARPDFWEGVGRLPFLHGRVVQLGSKVQKVARQLQTVRKESDVYSSLLAYWPGDAALVRDAAQLQAACDEDLIAAGIPGIEQRMMLLDALSYLPDDILTKVDRAAMGASLETRAPFLDHRVVELAWRLPLHMKIRKGQGKWAVRQVLHKYVPRELIERPKAGFAIPIGTWLRGPLRSWAEALLDPVRLRREGFLNPLPIQQSWSRHLRGQEDCTGKLWTVLMFQAWLERNS